jgi:hypothetical protein
MTNHIPTTDCETGNCPVCNFAAGIGRREAHHGELMTGELHPIFKDAPAVMPSLDDATYFADCDAVSQSMLKLVADRRMVLYHASFVARRLPFTEPSRAMELGTAIHGCILEGKALDDVLRVIPPNCLKSNGAINPVPTAEFKASLPPGCAAVKMEELHGVVAAVDAVRTRIGKLLELPQVLFERAIYWTHPTTGLRCRMKADIIADVGPFILVTDLKTTDDAEASKFRQKIIQMKYWIQAAQYTEGVRLWAKDVLNVSKPVQFRFLAIERDGLCQCSEHMLMPGDMAQAEDSRDRLMKRLAEAYKENRWHDEWEQEVNEVSLPDYAYGV